MESFFVEITAEISFTLKRKTKMVPVNVTKNLFFFFVASLTEVATEGASVNFFLNNIYQIIGVICLRSQANL